MAGVRLAERVGKITAEIRAQVKSVACARKIEKAVCVKAVDEGVVATAFVERRCKCETLLACRRSKCGAQIFFGQAAQWGGGSRDGHASRWACVLQNIAAAAPVRIGQDCLPAQF